MTIQCDIHYEMTDTFVGEANYSWVKRGVIGGEPGKDIKDLQAVRRAKKALDISGLRCSSESDGDVITLRPHGQCIVIFITLHSHGSCPR